MRVVRGVWCVAAIGLGLFAPSAQAMPTLTGETLILQGASTVRGCTDGNVTYAVGYFTGDGPYVGTFSEEGRVHVESVNPMNPTEVAGPINVDFTIHSGALTITGTKSNSASNPATCNGSGSTISAGPMQYSAQWTTTKGNALLATRARYADQGTSTMSTTIFGFDVDETYTSSLDEAKLVKCELVVAGLLALPLPASSCPG